MIAYLSVGNGKGECKSCKKVIKKGQLQVVVEDTYTHYSARIHSNGNECCRGRRVK